MLGQCRVALLGVKLATGPFTTGGPHIFDRPRRAAYDALGLPIAKFERAAPELVSIGSGIDTIRMRVSVPHERVDYTISLCKQFAKEREICRARQLSFISRVIRWRRPYIADLFALARKSATCGGSHIRMRASLRVSIQWWIDALTDSHGCR